MPQKLSFRKIEFENDLKWTLKIEFLLFLWGAGRVPLIKNERWKSKV